ncbi:MAG TPA: hypothetical protein VJ921_10630 [Vicinamibacteria bacterium]|nr:hypothetical protein [Vicinamibacteria bacterium]
MHFLLAFLLASETAADLETVARIKMEGFQRSQVMEVLFYLTDLYGPRLHSSKNLDDANMDVYDHVREEDLKQAAFVVASVAYLTAMRDQKLPRKPLSAAGKSP